MSYAGARGSDLLALILPTASGKLKLAKFQSFLPGLCGAQGGGKSTLVASLAKTLETQEYGTAILSLDDLCLSSRDRLDLRLNINWTTMVVELDESRVPRLLSRDAGY